MEDTTQVGAIETAADPEGANGPQTLMEQLRAKRQEVAETKEVKIPLPGYEEYGLQAQYRLMDRPEVEKIGKRLKKNGIKDAGQFQMLALVDVIINATEGFYIQQDGQTVELTNGDDGPHIQRWEQLAEFMGYQGTPETARIALYWIFGDNEFAIGNHGISLNRWFGNTGSEVNLEFLGEAGG